MPTHLKAYTPSEKGKELISILFPMSHADREKCIIDYWKQYPIEVGALLDGFHFTILEIIDNRNTNESEDIYNLPEELFQVIFKGMKEQKNFFSFSTGKEFLKTLGELQPSIFKEPEKIARYFDPSIPLPQKKYVSKFNLPDQFEPAVLEKLTEICTAADKWYDKAIKTLPSMLNSQKIIAKYQNVNNEISLMDVKLASETLRESKKNYTKNAAEIAQNWLYIHDVYCKYPDEVVVNQVYIKYLAKLLGSREARYPVENYVLTVAKGPFNLAAPDFEPTDAQLQHELTKVSIRQQYLKELRIDINRLESRYRKRKLMVKLKEKISKNVIIKELLEISQIDPLDIKTHLLLARMFSEVVPTIKDHQKRTGIREQALKFCKIAFSKIDDYMDLQQIQVLRERDIQRASFVKSISAIRIPLIRNK
jgi:hypothetical protein